MKTFNFKLCFVFINYTDGVKHWHVFLRAAQASTSLRQYCSPWRVTCGQNLSGSTFRVENLSQQDYTDSWSALQSLRWSAVETLNIIKLIWKSYEDSSIGLLLDDTHLTLWDSNYQVIWSVMKYFCHEKSRGSSSVKCYWSGLSPVMDWNWLTMILNADAKAWRCWNLTLIASKMSH